MNSKFLIPALAALLLAGAALADIWYEDLDADGWGNCNVFVDSPTQPAGSWSTQCGDCDESDHTIYPGAPEIVGDGIDQDCDGGELCYYDADLDGYGGNQTLLSADIDCEEPGEWAINSECDDSDASVYPGAPEIPGNGIDDDCDGVIDGGTVASEHLPWGALKSGYR